MLDCSKAKRRLGWHPHLDLKTTLEWVNEWYMGYSRSIESAHEIADYQISRYTEMLK